MKKTVFILLFLALALSLPAQTAREEIAADRAKAAGLHYAYPGPQGVQTPAPKGYKAFYISHFGRHGSRWHTSEEDYKDIVQFLQKVREDGLLTPVGEDALTKAETMWEDAKGHIGELTPLGMRQHESVAGRMFKSFPEAFKGDARVTANSTLSPRVMMSMFYFCNTLKKLNPSLQIEINSSRRDSRFVSNRYKPEEKPAYDVQEETLAFMRKIIKPGRLMDVLFTDPASVGSECDRQEVFCAMCYLTGMTQNVGLDSLSFADIFTDDEWYDYWRVGNYELYLFAADPRADEIRIKSCSPMIAHIIEQADSVIGESGRGATLRFSHDSYLVPMAICLGLDGCTGQAENPEDCDQVFWDYKISPMCGNIQIVFFRNRKGDVLVKFLLNENEVGIPLETDCYPFYRWDDVKAYYKTLYNI